MSNNTYITYFILNEQTIRVLNFNISSFAIFYGYFLFCFFMDCRHFRKNAFSFAYCVFTIIIKKRRKKKQMKIVEYIPTGAETETQMSVCYCIVDVRSSHLAAILFISFCKSLHIFNSNRLFFFFL